VDTRIFSAVLYQLSYPGIAERVRCLHEERGGGPDGI
jgi:hypothetical protein